ncbi:hypothetical protein FSP39_014414 [Pinctada imbricata]|uniref:Uncharacterized protein n=1 Tax=Pinctada imbricata TaxID=66713 RepID=A0AA88YD59_PINIB|nr:hypothetical protein FSP39_014414 [Pinctada imbricata]
MEKAIFKENESEEMDQYVASIELSNKCREFYHKRMESAESMKQRLSPKSKTGKKSSLDLAFEKLGKEMSSLMDQDLSLMKQLLMLNESIEELKWKRRCSYESVNDSFM